MYICIRERESQKIHTLQSEAEKLRLRLEKLMKDKAAMDSELNQLDSLLPN